MTAGWVKLHRKLVDNPIFKNDKLFRVFMYCLLKASHKDHEQLVGDSIVALKAGELATGRAAISSATGLSEQNIKTAISKLKALGIITSKPTNKYSIISILNWDSYQQDNQQVTSSQPASNQHVTTNKNVKNEKNVKNKGICQQVADEYNALLGDHLGCVKVLSDKRKAWIKGSIKQMSKTDHDFSLLETWQKYFDYVSQSDFLMGRVERSDWSASFDFLVNKNNLLKVVEGKYE